MTKQRLLEKLVDFQRDIISLSQALQAKEQAFQDGEDHLLLELMLVLDAFENIFNSLEDKAETFDKSMRRALKSFTRIQSKIRRILEARGVEQIALPDGKAVVGLCKVVETQAVERSLQPSSAKPSGHRHPVSEPPWQANARFMND